MAHVMVPFANGKGGVGKTALACSYAVARARQGADVILTDLNEEQHTARSWAEVRDHNRLLPKLKVEAVDVRQALEMIGRCDVLVVDSPGWTDRGTLALAKRATFMVIPTGPNPTYDLAPTVRLLHGLRAEGIEPWRLGVAFNRFSPDEAARAEEDRFAREYLSKAGYTALEGCVRYAGEFSRVLAEGYGLSEISGADELRDEALHMMDVISAGVNSAERRLDRQGAQFGRGAERGRGRDRE